MQDELTTSPPVPPARRQRSAQGILIVAPIAFLLGIALAGWLVWSGKLAEWFHEPEVVQAAAPPPAASPSPRIASQVAVPPPSPDLPGLAVVETRLALLEERMSRLDLKAESASGNAARAEALLVAFAARRMVVRGEPLGYLENQLRLRFGNAQPNAVQAIIEAAKKPVTLDQLTAQLVAASPTLTRAPKDEDAWARVKREISNLVVIRRDTSPSPAPQSRIERARLMLASGKVDEAIAEVQRLPGASGAEDWIAAARRYSEAQRALDLIEATAMLEPYSLQDGEGRKVDQPSPLAPTAEEAYPGTTP